MPRKISSAPGSTGGRSWRTTSAASIPAAMLLAHSAWSGQSRTCDKTNGPASDSGARAFGQSFQFQARHHTQDTYRLAEIALRADGTIRAHQKDQQNGREDQSTEQPGNREENPVLDLPHSGCGSLRR